MKIVHVTAYYPPHIGGQETVVKHLVEDTSKKYKVEVITSDKISNGKKLKNTENVTIHYCKSIEFGSSAIIFSLFFRLLSLSREDIVHVHVSNAFVPEIVFLASFIKGFSYLAHIHIDTQASSNVGILLPIYKKYILTPVIKKAKHIIVPTKDYYELIIKKYNINSKKISVIPNGININNYSLSQGILHKPVQLLFVGRLSKQKNIITLINAFKQVLKKYIDLNLNIVGTGEEVKTIMEEIKKDKLLSKKIKLHGPLVGNNLRKIYKNSDIFILPSKYESFGVVLLEAMASKLPIIASNIDAIKNIITDGENGILVSPDKEAIAKAIESMIAKPELRKRIRENAYKEVRKYSWDSIMPRIESIYLNSMK